MTFCKKISRIIVSKSGSHQDRHVLVGEMEMEKDIQRTAGVRQRVREEERETVESEREREREREKTLLYGDDSTNHPHINSHRSQY